MHAPRSSVAGQRAVHAARPRSRRVRPAVQSRQRGSTRSSRTAAANSSGPARIGELRVVDAAELLRARMHVDECLLRRR